MSELYILEGERAVREWDIAKWAKWFESTDRNVRQDQLDDTRVSTVFLGVNHAYTPGEPPVLFESMVFGGEFDQHQERYATWREAVEGHERIVGKLRSGIL